MTHVVHSAPGHQSSAFGHSEQHEDAHALQMKTIIYIDDRVARLLIVRSAQKHWILKQTPHDLPLSKMQRYCRIIPGPSFDTWLGDKPKAHFKPEERYRHFFLAHGSASIDGKRLFILFCLVIHVLWAKYNTPGLSSGFPCSLTPPWCLRTPEPPWAPPPTMGRSRQSVAINPSGVLLPSRGVRR